MKLSKSMFLKSIALSTIIALLAPAATAKSSLWKATKGDEVLYVQGSAHVLTADSYPLARAIEQAYSNSTALVLEVDMAEMTSPKTQQLIMGKAMLKQPDTLKTVLSPLTYDNLQGACDEAGLPMEAVEGFKPWFATMTLALLKMQQLGMDAQYGLDQHFYNRAVKEGKKVVGLETVDFQISLFDTLADQDPDAFVDRSLMDLKFIEEDVKTLLQAWKTGDINTLNNLFKKSFDEYPGLYDKFVTDRNKTWSKKLSAMVKDQETYMVVVGAGHLPGEEGLLKLLEKKGFAVEQL